MAHASNPTSAYLRILLLLRFDLWPDSHHCRALRERKKLGESAEVSAKDVWNLSRPRDRKIMGCSYLQRLVPLDFGNWSYHTYHFTESVTFLWAGLSHGDETGTWRPISMGPMRASLVWNAHWPWRHMVCEVKLSGTYQLYARIQQISHARADAGLQKPRPAQETCEPVSLPEKFVGNLDRTYSIPQR